MAEITRASVVSPASTLLLASDKLPDLKVGEDILPGQPCYIKNDGTVYRSIASANTGAADVHGWSLNGAKVAQGQTVTLAKRVIFNYATGLTPGKCYFLSAANAGGIADASSTYSTVAIAHAIDTTRIEAKTNYSH